MRLQLAARDSSSGSPLPFFRTRVHKPPPSTSSSTIEPELETNDLDDISTSSVLPYSQSQPQPARSGSIPSLSGAGGRTAQDGDRPLTIYQESERDRDNTSIMRLVREDYVTARCYVKEMDYKSALRKALRRHMYKWYAIAIIIGTITALLSAKHETVVEFCEPVTRSIRAWPGGWLIPIALLVVVSFPPLVGHEIIGILCGLVWGLGVGFAILAVGTFLGEIATWVAFKWFCQGRAAKFEKKNKLYASLTQLIREKSFMFALVLRFSAVPGHITTAVSASAGANFWQYLAAAFLTLPKQFVIVYLGKAFGTESRKNTIISIVTTIITLIGTVIAAIYIYYQMRLVMRRQSGTIPTIVESDSNACATMSMTMTMEEKSADGLHSRRPWLHTNNSSISTNGSGMRTPTRSWSMPGHMNEEELREWVKEIRDEHKATASASASAGKAAENSTTSSTPAIRVEEVGIFDNTPNVFSTPLTPTPRRFGAPELSRFTTATPISMENDYLVPPETGEGSNSSATSIIDLSLSYPPTPIPNKRERESPAPTPVIRGGREIADEADTYALAHGARRPNYGRMRGDSRAALLGKPTSADDAALEMGGGSWKREYGYGRYRGDSSASSTLGARPMNILDDLDFVVENGVNEWKRNRGRAESGAAVMGRPRDNDSISSSGTGTGKREEV